MANSNTNSQNESWVERALDRFWPQPGPPTRPQAPAVDRTRWEKSVDDHKVNTLTVHDVGLIVFNEARSYANRDDANEMLSSAREKVAHAAMNADDKYGAKRMSMASTALPIEPSAKALQNPATKESYDSSLAAARYAYLSADDPTRGATHFEFRTNADRSNLKFKNGNPEGLPLKKAVGTLYKFVLKK